VARVDYSKPESIKSALSGVDVVISTISGEALDVQGKIAEAAREVGVKLFIPSDFGNITEGETEGMFGAKAGIQTQLKRLGVPYAVFYTGPFADFIWEPFLDLDVKSGKVEVAGDGNKGISFTSRTDIARYLSYVLTRLPPDQLTNRSFTIEGDHKSFNEIFKAYEAKTGRRLTSLTSPFPTLMQESPLTLRTYLLFYTSSGLLQDHSHAPTMTCIPTGTRLPSSTTSPLPKCDRE